MEINYTFRLSDYVALSVAMRPQRRRRLETIITWVLVLLNLVIGTGLIVLSGIDANRGILSWNFGIALTLLVVHYGIAPWVTRFNFRRIGLGGKSIRIKLDDEAVNASQPGASSRIEWAAIIRHSQLPTHAFLWISKIQAVVIPFDAFPNQAAKSAFLAFIQSKVPLSD